jgi:hypothetical protein
LRAIGHGAEWVARENRQSDELGKRLPLDVLVGEFLADKAAFAKQ